MSAGQSVLVVGLVRDAGTVVVFDAITDRDEHIRIGVDHRPAYRLAEALEDDPPVRAWVEGWQVIA